MNYKTILFILILTTKPALAATPKLNFSDLISGPDVGLGDGLGSGVIVTLWGQNLGSSQGASTLTFTDANNVVLQPAHIYYWKNADGNLPGGPANLYESHKMQEIAFSIPDATTGLGEVTVSVNSEASNSLPFTIRTGNIYHVKSTGSDSNTGTWSSPWLTLSHAEDNINEPGATLYVHDSIVTGTGDLNTTRRGVYWNNSQSDSSLAAQYGFIAYPNSQPIVRAYSGGFLNYQSSGEQTGQVVSKFIIEVSNRNEIANGQPSGSASGQSTALQTSQFGRGVANRISDWSGGCASKAQGAISGNARDGDRVSGYKIYGNEIHDYGCEGSNKLHHTTYISIRSDPNNTQVDPWEFGWNYLHDNPTKNGIHNYDETGACGDITGKVLIHDNVIINQGGSGINVGSTCGWSNDWDIYNNILINTGLASDWDGIDVETANGANTSAITFQDDGLTGAIRVFNNTVIKWNDDDLSRGTRSAIGLNGSSDNLNLIVGDNIFSTDKDLKYIATGFQAAALIDNPVGSNNIWFYSGNSPSFAIVPLWDVNAITFDPLLTIIGAKVSVGQASPLIDNGINNSLTHDIYGSYRNVIDIGAVEFIQTNTDLIYANGFE